MRKPPYGGTGVWIRQSPATEIDRCLNPIVTKYPPKVGKKCSQLLFLEKTTNQSVRECSIKCENRPDCMFFVINQSETSCILKNVCDEIDGAGFDLYTKNDEFLVCKGGLTAALVDNQEFHEECKLTEGGTDLVSTITTSGLITWQRHTTVETKNVIVQCLTWGLENQWISSHPFQIKIGCEETEFLGTMPSQALILVQGEAIQPTLSFTPFTFSKSFCNIEKIEAEEKKCFDFVNSQWNDCPTSQIINTCTGSCTDTSIIYNLEQRASISFRLKIILTGQKFKYSDMINLDIFCHFDAVDERNLDIFVSDEPKDIFIFIQKQAQNPTYCPVLTQTPTNQQFLDQGSWTALSTDQVTECDVQPCSQFSLTTTEKPIQLKFKIKTVVQGQVEKESGFNNIAITCGPQSTHVVGQMYHSESLSDFQNVQRNDKGPTVQTMFVLPEYLLSNIYCHIREIVIVSEDSVLGQYIEDTRFQSVHLDQFGHNVTIPHDKDKAQDLYFKIYLKHYGGYEYISSRMRLSVGCTETIEFTENPLFIYETQVKVNTTSENIHKIEILTNDRQFCPIRKNELINVREDGQLKPDAVKFNDRCIKDEICSKLDIQSTIPVKVVVFQVRSYVDDGIYHDSDSVTIRVICHNDKECKSRSQDFDHWIKDPCGDQFYVKDPKPYFIDMVVNLNQTFLLTKQNLTDFISSNQLECPLRNLTIVQSKETNKELDPIFRKVFEYDQDWNLTILGSIKRDIGKQIWARYTNIGGIDIYKPILANFRINRGPILTEYPQKLQTEIKLQVSEADQLKGLKEKFFIIESPIAEDKEQDQIIFILETVETLKCACIQLIEKQNDSGPYFQIKIDQRRISANDTGIHKVMVSLRDNQLWYSKNQQVLTIYLTIDYKKLTINEEEASNKTEKAENNTEVESNLQNNKTLENNQTKESNETKQNETNSILSQEMQDLKSVDYLLSNSKEPIIGAMSQPNIVKATPAVVEAFLEKLYNPLPKQVKQQAEISIQKPPLDVRIRIIQISGDGKVTIGFNQALNVPQFKENTNDTNGRLLEEFISYQDIDVSRDLIDISFILNSEIEQKPEYFLVLTDWQSHLIEVQMNFTDPLIISKGALNDQVVIKVKNRNFFVSQESGLPIKDEHAFQVSECPRQVPTGVNVEKVESQASETKTVMYTLIYVQMVVQLLFKNSMSYWFPLFMALQMINYLVIYNDLPIPANTTIFLREFTKVVEFESLNPLGVVRFFDPEFKLDRWIYGGDKNQIITNADQTATIMKDLRMMFVLGISFFLVLCMMKIVSFCSNSHKKYLNDTISGILQRFTFNGYIGTMMMGYVKLNIAVKVQVEIYNKHSVYLNESSQNGARVIVTKIIATFLFVTILIFVTQGDLSHDRYKRVRRITAGLKIKKNRLNKYYFSIFMIKRSIYAMIPVIFIGYQGFQIISLISMQMFFMMMNLFMQPLIQFDRNVLEFVNDVITMFAFYHMACFSEFPLDSLAQFQMGYSFNGVILSMVGCNLYYGVSNILMEHRQEKSLLARRVEVQSNLSSILRRDEEQKRVRRERRCIKRDMLNYPGSEESQRERILLQLDIQRHSEVWTTVLKKREVEEQKEAILEAEKQKRRDYLNYLEEKKQLMYANAAPAPKKVEKPDRQDRVKARFYFHEKVEEVAIVVQTNPHIFSKPSQLIKNQSDINVKNKFSKPQLFQKIEDFQIHMPKKLNVIVEDPNEYQEEEKTLLQDVLV